MNVSKKQNKNTVHTNNHIHLSINNDTHSIKHNESISVEKWHHDNKNVVSFYFEK